jgi:uncharacterized protein with beta-barrel porin domain
LLLCIGGVVKSIAQERCRSAWLVAAAALVFAIAAPSRQAWAQCQVFPVQSNQTCTNSVNLTNTSIRGGVSVGLQDLATLTVTNTNSGTISATGLSSLGIYALDVIANNSGTVSGIGGSSLAIYAAQNATVTNFGTISGIGVNTYGIFANYAATVTNFGTISGGYYGVYAANSGPANAEFVTNSGTISGGNTGIFAGGKASVTNSGIISGAGAGGGGIVAGNAAVTNSGTVLGTGAQTYGILAFTGNASVTNSGSVSGGDFGIFVPNGSATVANSGMISGATGILLNNPSSGSILINSGTIIGTGGTAIDMSTANNASTINQQGGTIAGAIKLSAFTDLINVTGGVINGNIVGQGLDNIAFALGASTFTYAAPYAMTGINVVSVNSGTALMNGTLAANTVNVNGGTLGGTGTITSAVSINGGALMPGLPNTIGALNIMGDLAFHSGSNYLITINGASASKTSVTGTATLNSGAAVNVASGSTIKVGQTYTILTASGGVSGTFNPGVNYGFFKGTLSYDATDAFLTFISAMARFLPPGSSTNQFNVAGAIDKFTNNGSMLPPGFQSLANLSPQQLAGALTQLSGEGNAGAQQGAFQMMNSFLSLMVNPYADNRGGGFGPAIGVAPEQQVFPPEIANAYASVFKAPAGMPVAYAPSMTIWSAAFGGTNNTGGDPAGVGSHDELSRTGGFASGLDYRLAPGTLLGFALAGGGTSWGLSAGLGGGRSDVFQAGIYGSRQFGAAYLSGALAFAEYWASTNRTVMVASLDQLTASFNAQSFGGRLEGGYRMNGWAPFGVTPYAAAQVQGFKTPSYSETAVVGSPQFALAFNARTATATRSELGSWFDKTYAFTNGNAINLFSRAAWAHDWVSDPSLTPTFLGLPTASFVVNGAAPPSNLGLLTAGAEYRWLNGVSLMGKFDSELANRAQTYTSTGRLRYIW